MPIQAVRASLVKVLYILQRLRIAVDIGGTFTDGVASLTPTSGIWLDKTPTTPDDPGVAKSIVIRQLLEQVHRDLGVPCQLSEMVHDTTLITNTLIERKGTRTALLTTRGPADVLELAREGRYDAYELDLVRPQRSSMPIAVSNWTSG
jgi:N-methylhydantoinase A